MSNNYASSKVENDKIRHDEKRVIVEKIISLDYYMTYT